MSRCSESNNKPVLVLTGRVGVGKSFLMEKLAGLSDLSSSGMYSFTDKSTWAETDNFIIIDTPGINPKNKFKFGHNLAVAQAFSFRPVSVMFIVVSANVRINDTVTSFIDHYSRLINFGRIICPMVTKMDTVDWTDEEFLDGLYEESKFNKAVFSSKGKDSKVLANDIVKIVAQIGYPMSIDMDSDKFLKYFKITGMVDRQVLEKTKEIYEEFCDSNNFFLGYLDNFSGDDKVDMLFEYQHFMLDMIDQCKQDLTNSCNLDFLGETMARDLSFVANLTNQLLSVLYKVRLKTLGFQKNHGVKNLRRCLHCKRVWTKVVGCDGQTTCGERVNENESRGIYATFKFSYRPLGVKKLKETKKVTDRSKNKGTIGCGNKITWSEMPTVQLPQEFENVQSAISTDDVSVLVDDETIKNTWKRRYEKESKKYEVKPVSSTTTTTNTAKEKTNPISNNTNPTSKNQSFQSLLSFWSM